MSLLAILANMSDLGLLTFGGQYAETGIEDDRVSAKADRFTSFRVARPISSPKNARRHSQPCLSMTFDLPMSIPQNEEEQV